LLRSLIAIDEKIDLHNRKKTVLEKLFQAQLQKLTAVEMRISELDLSSLETVQSLAVTA